MNDGMIQKRKHNFLKKWKIVELKLEVSDIDTHLSTNFQIIRDIKLFNNYNGTRVND